MLQPHPRDGAARDHARRALSPPVLEKAGCCEEHYERGFRRSRPGLRYDVARALASLADNLWHPVAGVLRRSKPRASAPSDSTVASERLAADEAIAQVAANPLRANEASL